jgi:uncharacterized protein (UPF0548 family)
MTMGSRSTPAASTVSPRPKVPAAPKPQARADTLSSSMQRRLRKLHNAPVNYDPDALDLDHPPADWAVDDRCQPLASEPPGEPIPAGSWETAKRLISGYEFADPSLVRAYYERDAPLEGRDMVLGLRALGIITIHAGVRVVDVYDEVREVDGRRAHVFGWAYRTLAGHVEQGQMDWMVWKWSASGAVEFRVRAVARPAPIHNPVIRIGFLLLRRHERRVFLDSTDRRMRELTALTVGADAPGAVVRAAGHELTARHSDRSDPGHERLARRADGQS